MDPNATLQRFIEALISGDRQDAREAHQDLTEWLARGGFEPKAWKKHRKMFQAFNPGTGLVDLSF